MRKFTHIERPAWTHTQISALVNWDKRTKKKEEERKELVVFSDLWPLRFRLLALSRLAPSLPPVVLLPGAMQKNDFALLHPSPSLQIIHATAALSYSLLKPAVTVMIKLHKSCQII